MNIGFTKAESDELRKYQTIRTVIKNNPISVAKSLMFKAKTLTFLDNLDNIEDEIANKNIDTSGFTENKNSLKEIVAIFYDPICSYAEEFAVEYKHTDLAKNVNYTESKIFNLKDGSVFGIVTAINAAITPFITDVNFIPYGVTLLYYWMVYIRQRLFEITYPQILRQNMKRQLQVMLSKVYCNHYVIMSSLLID